MSEKDFLDQIAEACGGTITEVQHLPDGSGFACMSMPLPKDHWIYQQNDEPPATFRGFPARRRKEVIEAVEAAAKYAVRGATMSGKEMDFDPDALLQNLMTGLFGYRSEWND